MTEKKFSDRYMGWTTILILCPHCKSGYLETKDGKVFCCFCKKEVSEKDLETQKMRKKGN